MFFSFSVLVYTLFFLAGLEVSAYSEKDIIWTIVIMIVLALVTVAGVKKVGKKAGYSIILSIFAFSAVVLLFLVANMFEKQVFILLSASVYYAGMIGIYRLREYEKDQTARGMIAAALVATAFFFYASIYGIYLNFAVPIWLLMCLYLAATVAISYQYFRLISPKRKIVWIYSLIIGMAMAEIAWVINFWPFGYLTTGVIALMLYYIFWDLTQSYFLNLLSKTRVITNMVFFGLLVALVLVTSRWLPSA
jgi:hypothetical protein